MNCLTPFRTLLILVLALTLLGPAHAGPASATITGGKGVGTYQLGKDFTAISDALGKPTKVQQSDVSDNARLVYYKKYGMYFFVKKDIVTAIQVDNPMFSTPEGIHVGSTRNEVIRAYGNPQALRSANVVYPERGLGFIFGEGKVTHINVFDKEDRDLASGDRRIVPGVRVGGIQLGGSVEFVVRNWKEPSKRAAGPNGSEMWSYQSHGVIVLVMGGRVDAVWLFNPEFRTVQDVHVGSKRDDVVRAYGKPKKKEENMEFYPDNGLGFLYEKGVLKQIVVKATK